MQRTDELLRVLLAGSVEFIVVGGVAAAAHGVAHVTADLDILAPFTEANFERLLKALAPYDPRNSARRDVRLLDEGPARLAGFRNLYLTCTIGGLDMLGEMPPLGSYADVLPETITLQLFGFPCRVLALDQLIRVKEHVRRPKDLLVLPELRAIREHLEAGGD